MAERRMFAKKIIDSDMFLDMPPTAQLLYFHLGMRADDDGFINNPKRIMRDVRCGPQDMQALIGNGYIIPFDTGVIVISHWRIHNYLRADRYKPTDCEEEKSMLLIESQKAYKLVDTNGIPNVNQAGDTTETNGIPSGIPLVDKMDTQVRDSDRDRDRDRGRIDEAILSSASKKSDDLQALMDFYEQNIEILTSFKVQRLEGYVDDFSYRWVDKALKYMANLSTDKRNSRYLGGLLAGWRRKGVPEPWKEVRGRKGPSETKTSAEMADNVIRMLRERNGLSDDTRPGEDDTDTGCVPEGIPKQ